MDFPSTFDNNINTWLEWRKPLDKQESHDVHFLPLAGQQKSKT